MKRLALVVGAMALTISQASAMDYSWRVAGNQIVVDASGDIEVDEGKHFIAWILQNHGQWNGRKATAIVFDSRGGVVSGGAEMGMIIDQFHMTTGVGHGGECASSCVLAWGAGAYKSAASDSKVGVHMSTETKTGDASVDGTLFLINWLQKLKAPNSVIIGLMSTKPDDIHWLTEKELIAWNVKIVEPVSATKTPTKCSDIKSATDRLDCYDRQSSNE
jgi:hypothetical protein